MTKIQNSKEGLMQLMKRIKEIMVLNLLIQNQSQLKNAKAVEEGFLDFHAYYVD